MTNNAKDSETRSETRREFLHKLASLLGLASIAELTELLASDTLAANKGGYKAGFKGAYKDKFKVGNTDKSTFEISGFRGDDFTTGHKLRNGEIPKFPKTASEKREIVIVGGGLSALVCAYYLRDEDFLLLEQYDELGGQSRGENHNGLWYSLGAAYFADNKGQTGELISDLGLSPVTLGSDKNSYFFEKKWFSGVNGNDKIHANFKQLKDDLEDVLDTLGYDEPKLPMHDGAIKKLDATPLSEMLKHYDPTFRALLDNAVKASVCGTSELVSMAAGAPLLNEFFGNSYVLPGGNPAVSRAITAQLKKDEKSRLSSGSFVWAVEIRDEGASVIYSNKKGEIKRVDCDHVILATPPMVTGRILTNVKNTAKGGLFTMRYGSYLVANLIYNRREFKGSYDNFLPAPNDISDITVAETPYLKNGTYKETFGSVLTIYQPYAPASIGRTLLLEGDKNKLAHGVVDSLKASINLPIPDKVVLSRWGHAISVPTINSYERLTQILASNQSAESYSLAHSSLYGIQSLENAVQAGKRAAKRALR